MDRLHEFKARAALLGMRYDASTHCFYSGIGNIAVGEWIDADTLTPLDRWKREARRIKFLSKLPKE